MVTTIDTYFHLRTTSHIYIFPSLILLMFDSYIIPILRLICFYFLFLFIFLNLFHLQHSIERCRLYSQKEREKRDLLDESYSYGEIDYEQFAKIFYKIELIYGINSRQSFLDLGCGVGTIVYTASIIGKFNLYVGIEYIQCLIDRADKRVTLWNKYTQERNSMEGSKIPQFRFLPNNFMINTDWISDVSFIFLHWTAFSFPQINDICILLQDCNEGTQCLTITHSIPANQNTGFIIIDKGFIQATWGKAEYFLHEKI